MAGAAVLNTKPNWQQYLYEQQQVFGQTFAACILHRDAVEQDDISNLIKKMLYHEMAQAVVNYLSLDTCKPIEECVFDEEEDEAGSTTPPDSGTWFGLD